MKNKIPCEVINDLFPSYIDELTSEVTNDVIEEHVSECKSCKKILNSMKNTEMPSVEPEEEIEIDFLKKEKKRVRNLILLIPAMAVVFLATFTVYAKSLKNESDFREFAASAKRGDTFSFGTYEQDNDLSDGAEEILWIVISNKDGQLHAISKYGLDSGFYHDEDEAVTWEESSLREWLNSDFYENAFSEEEKSRIISPELSNRDNPYYNTKGGNSTQDFVSLLTVKEAETLTRDISICFPTPYGMQNGIYSDPETGHCEWWLRTVGINENTASTVGKTGYTDAIGSRVVCPGVAVRPCIYIEYETVQ